MSRVWDDAVVTAVAREIPCGSCGAPRHVTCEHGQVALRMGLGDVPCPTRLIDATAVLTAAADAVEGAIRAEASAPVQAVYDRIIERSLGANGDEFIALVNSGRNEVLSVLRDVLGDPDAIAKHNAAIARAAVLDYVRSKEVARVQIDLTDDQMSRIAALRNGESIPLTGLSTEGTTDHA